MLAAACLFIGCSNEKTSNLPAFEGSADLTWDPIVDMPFSGYKVYYGTSSGKYLQTLGNGIDAGNSPHFIVTGLGQRGKYYFAVTALYASNIESDYSNEVVKDIP